MNFLFQIALGLIPAILVLAVGAAVRRFSLARAVPLLVLFIGAALACSVLGVVRHSQGAASAASVLDPSEALALAQAAAQRGDAELAQALLEQSGPELVQPAQATLCLARTYALQGNAPAASALYRKVQALDPQAGVDRELQAASRAALSGLSDSQAVQEMIRLAQQAVEDLSSQGEDLDQTARTLSQINACYEDYLTSGELDEDEVRRLSRRMDALKEDQPELFALDPVRLAQLKISILAEDYGDIAQSVDENSGYDELLVVSELYLNGYIRARDFDSGYGQEYARQCAVVAEQVERLYNDYYVTQSRSVRNSVKEYLDSLTYAQRNPALVQLKNDLYDYTQTPGASDSSKVFLQLAKIENDAGNSAGAEQYLTDSLGAAGDCLDDSYTQPMYEIIGIIADKDDPERLKDVAGYVDRILTNSSVIQMPEELTHPASDPDSQDPEEEDSAGFDRYMTDYVSQKRSALNIAQVDPSAFPEVTATLSISTPIPYTDQELAGRLSVQDCGINIPDFTLEQIHYDRVNVLLCCDVSGSMSGQAIADLREAVQLFAGSLEDNQRLALVTFADSVKAVYPFGTDPEEILTAAGGLGAYGGTDMYSACLYAMDLFQPAQGERNVIILLSDGEDNYRRSEDDLYNNLAKAAEEKQVTLYTLGLGSSVDSGYLSSMAGMCGGTYLYVDDSQTLNSFYEYLNGLMFSQYRLRYTAVDTLRASSRRLFLSMTDDPYCQDTALYSLDGSDSADGEQTGANAVSLLAGVVVTGLDTRLLFKGPNSQEIHLLGSGLKEELELSLTIKGNVDYDLSAEYESDSSWKVTVPAGVACGVYDLYVKVGDKTAVLDRELTVVVQGQEKSVTFGPYVFTAYSVVHEENSVTLSSLVSMNGWLHFRGDVTLTGDLNGGSVLMSDAYGAYIQYYEGSSSGLAALYAKNNWKLEVPILGQRTLYSSSGLDPSDEDYPVDTTLIPALYFIDAFTMAAPGASLYADRLEIQSDAFTTAFPLQDKLLKKVGSQNPFSFDASITGQLTATQIGVSAKIQRTHNEDVYYPVNLGAMPIYINPAEWTVELDTLKGEFSLDFTIRLAFLGSTDDGFGLKLAWDGSLIPTEVGVNIDHNVTTNISGVPVTFSDFYFGVKDIRGSNPLMWSLVGQATASAYKVEDLLPGIGKWFGDVSVCSLKDATVEFSLGQAHLLMKTDFYLLGQIKLANAEIEAGRFNYSCWLLNMDQESMAGMRAKLGLGLVWESDNCDINISGSTELVLSNRMLGVVNTGTFQVAVQWWILQKEVRANGSAVLGMYRDHSNELVFILKGVASNDRKDSSFTIAWTKNTGLDVQVKL